MTRYVQTGKTGYLGRLGKTSLPAKKIRWIRSLLLLVFFVPFLVFSGCSGPDGQKGGPQGKLKGKQGAFQGKRPPQAAIPVALEKARVGDIASYYTATASLSAEKEAQVMARASGVVQSLHCEEGDYVKKDQVLLSIDNEEYQYRLAQAEANRLDLQSRFDRLQALKKQRLVSTEEYEGVQNDLKSAEAEENLARLNLSYTRVKAPFSGYIVSRSVDVGQTVSSGSNLFLLSDFNPLLAKVHVPSKEFKKLQPDQAVDLVLESNRVKLTGKIKLVSPIIDPSSGTIKVTIEIDEYPAGVRPGDFAEISIVTELRSQVVLVPAIAVVSERGQSTLFVATDGKADRRIVEVGFQDDAHAQILSGVEVGEPVVVKGQRLLKPGSPIKVPGEEMASSSGEQPPESDKKKGRRKGGKRRVK